MCLHCARGSSPRPLHPAPCQVPGASVEEGNDAEQLSEAAMATAVAVIEFARVVEGAGLDQLKGIVKVRVG